MNTINFQNKEFKVRELEIPEIGKVLISITLLNESLLNDKGGYVSEEAISVDEKIYYFVSDNEIELSNKKLIKLISTETK